MPSSISFLLSAALSALGGEAMKRCGSKVPEREDFHSPGWTRKIPWQMALRKTIVGTGLFMAKS